MAPTLNQDDIKLLKSIFTTKEDLKPLATTKQLKTEIKMSEMRLIKRMDEMDNFLDRETVRLARDIDKLKPSSVQYT